MGQLLVGLFILYILRSVFEGISRGGRAGKRGPDSSEKPGLPTWSDVLDMDELERRLRELRGDEPSAESSSETFVEREERYPPVLSIPAPVSPPPTSEPATIAAPQQPAPPARRTAEAVDMWADDGDWDDALLDSVWDDVPLPATHRRDRAARRTDQLPAAVQAYVDRGTPWQAAFVLKELLGPPRGLSRDPRRRF